MYYICCCWVGGLDWAACRLLQIIGPKQLKYAKIFHTAVRKTEKYGDN